MIGRLEKSVLAVTLTLAFFCTLAAAAEDETQIRWRSGKVVISYGSEVVTLEESNQVLAVDEAFQINQHVDGGCEVIYPDLSRVEFWGNCRVEVGMVAENEATVVASQFDGFRVKSEKYAIWMKLPGSYSFRTEKQFIEGRTNPKGEIVLSNWGGKDLVIYHFGLPADRLPNGIRIFMVPTATENQEKRVPNRDNLAEWAFREMEIPGGVVAQVKGSNMEIKGTSELTDSRVVVRYGGIYLLIGDGGLAIISNAGRLVGLHGRAIVLRARTDWTRVFSSNLPASPATAGASGGGVFGRNDVAQDPPDTSPGGGTVTSGGSQ